MRSLTARGDLNPFAMSSMFVQAFLSQSGQLSRAPSGDDIEAMNFNR